MNNILIKIKNGLIWFFKSFIWITPLVIIVDQVTKLVIESSLGQYDVTGKQISIFSEKFINIRVTYNMGAAWSMLSSQHWLLSLISVVATIAIIVYIAIQYKKIGLWERICGLLILGGCMGNMIDRLFYSKGVIDFISTGFMNFPTFNIADSCLCVGIFLLIIKFIIDEFKGKHKDEEKPQDSK
ncbi:MAG: signal peptidase II [Erysipelotrichales bacterium]|nr:signal peptidase II [Erysipelotrichales bacterium]